jgi:hypothetical protein
MSDIDSKITMALTATKSSRKPYTVQPLTKHPAAAQGNASPSGADSIEPATAADHITPDEAIALEARCTENNIKTASVKKFFGVELLSQLTPAQLIVAHENITVTLAKRLEQQNA